MPYVEIFPDLVGIFGALIGAPDPISYRYLPNLETSLLRNI
jgi:hypothetical protein